LFRLAGGLAGAERERCREQQQSGENIACAEVFHAVVQV